MACPASGWTRHYWSGANDAECRVGTVSPQDGPLYGFTRLALHLSAVRGVYSRWPPPPTCMQVLAVTGV